MCLETFNVWWFQVSENCSSQQNYKKKRATKNQENSAQRFEETFLTNELAKFLQDRIKLWKVGTFKALVIIFL